MAGFRNIPISLTVWLTLCAVHMAPADILHLRDGSRHSGKQIAETPKELLFRIDSPDGKASTVRKFPRDLVERVEIGVQPAPMDDVEDPETENPPAPDADHAQWLREAFELVDRGELRPALRILTRLARIPDRAVLQTLSEECEKTRGRPLDVWIAEVRMQSAVATTRDGVIRFAGVTEYESSALGRLLEIRLRELLGRTHEGRSLHDWTIHQRKYTRATTESPALVRDARIASAMLSVRIKHDPQLRENRDERIAAIALRDELARLAAWVSSLRGFGTDAAAAPSAADFGPPYEPKPRDGRELYSDDDSPAVPGGTLEQP